MKVLESVLVATCLMVASPAAAQTLACGADGDGDGTGDLCFHVKYGTLHPDDRAFRYPADGLDTSVWNPAAFTGSYFYTRTDSTNPFGDDCGVERNFNPTAGQLIVRELVGCTPTSEGPEDAANGGEAGGCRVEIPQDLEAIFGDAGLSAVQSQVVVGFPGVFVLNSSTRSYFGGTSEAMEEGQACFAGNQLPPSMGRRYLLSAARQAATGQPAGSTYIRWDDNPTTGLRRYQEGGTCCNGVTPETCTGLFPTLVQYPALGVDSCTNENVMYHLRRTGDWLFQGGPGTDFISDPEYAPIGQSEGVCETNRLTPCDTVPNHTFQGNPCPGLGDTANLPALSSNSGPRVVEGCDLRERGSRVSVPATTGAPDFLPIVNECANSQVVLRGHANRFCSIINRYTSPGDPSSNCNIANFGGNPRPDDDCDGVIDEVAPGVADLCPFLNEFDYFANSDLAAGGDAVQIRGDECECGDQQEDGIINVSDILDINTAIFSPEIALPICDANNDLLCNIGDILDVNNEIFNPGFTSCRQVTRLSCGNGVIDLEEDCDDGNIQNGDGCDSACLLE